MDRTNGRIYLPSESENEEESLKNVLSWVENEHKGAKMYDEEV